MTRIQGRLLAGRHFAGKLFTALRLEPGEGNQFEGRLFGGRLFAGRLFRSIRRGDMPAVQPGRGGGIGGATMSMREWKQRFPGALQGADGAASDAEATPQRRTRARRRKEETLIAMLGRLQ